MSLGTRVKQQRIAYNLSQAQLGEKTGLTQASVSRIESDSFSSSEALLDIARTLKVSPFWLQTGEGEPDDTPLWLIKMALQRHINQEQLDSLKKETETASQASQEVVRILSTLLEDQDDETTPDLDIDRPKRESDGDTCWLDNLKREIDRQRLTQNDLTAPLGVSTRGAVGHYLNERRQLSIEQFSALCRVLKTAPDKILGFTTDDDTQAPQLDVSELTQKLLHRYRQKAQECTEKLMELRSENRGLKRKGPEAEARRQQVLSEIKETNARRQIYLETENDIMLLEDELGI